MNSDKLPAFERLIILLGLLCFGILFYRCVFTFSVHYTFLLWKLLIAIIPYVISTQLLRCKKLNLRAFLLLFCWMLFLPASIYLFTDLLQLSKSNNIGFFYDIILFSSFAFTGLLPGLVSLKHVETFLKKYLPGFLVTLSIIFFIFLSSYSVYVVSFLHITSWNIIADFKKMFQASKNNILNSEDNTHLWLSIGALGLFIDVLYQGFKHLYRLKKDNHKLLLP
jgi:uncharacterized membrane protein